MLRYNRSMRVFLFLTSLLLMLSSCEYPEQGFYEIVGLDEDGRITARQPFIIEEYVDDSEMTQGFGLLLPHIDGEHLVSIPLEATEGFESRGWTIRTNARQTGHGDLFLEMTHIGERLKFSGSLLVAGQDAAQAFNGTVRSEDGITSIIFIGGTPALPEAFAGTTDWQLRRIDAEGFEELSGIAADAGQVPLMPRDKEEEGSKDTKRQAAEPGPDRGDPPPPPTR